jgi:hypothetical protein
VILAATAARHGRATASAPLGCATRRQWTRVCWSGVRAPSADDIVALSVPADALDRKTAPVKYKWAALAAGHLSTGAGCHECVP